MPSLKNGDYRLVGAIQGSKPDRWYRQLIHARQPHRDNNRVNLSCDCPAWTNNVGGDRTCKHTAVTEQLLLQNVFQNAQPVGQQDAVQIRNVRAMQPLLQGIEGQWRIEECRAPIANSDYRFSLLEVRTDHGDVASAFVASAEQHHAITQDITAALAAWAGWAIAAEIARQGGYHDIGQPPDHHYRHVRPNDAGGTSTRAVSSSRNQRFGIYDLLDLANQTDLGDGLQPTQRAEQTLALFLGPQYQQIQRQHFLDVSSRQYPGRVYRLRLDPDRRADRRVRVFENGSYSKDFCIVRQDRLVPVQDAFLTIFMGLLSNENNVLRVVGEYNKFEPYSDSHERELVPAIWRSPTS